MAKGQPQDQVLSAKNLLSSPSWDPEYMKRVACGKNLSDPGGEKQSPSVPHIYHLCSLEGIESWSPSGGNTDTAGVAARKPQSVWTPQLALHTHSGKLYGYHMIRYVLPSISLGGLLGGWAFLA